MKFEKAMVRVKGAVQPVRKPEAMAYGGEATGIKTKVAKSRRL
jgi:U3 small nucleolar RNA-associated protein 3